MRKVVSAMSQSVDQKDAIQLIQGAENTWSIVLK